MACAGLVLAACSSEDSRPAAAGSIFGAGGSGVNAGNGGSAGSGGAAGDGGAALGGSAGSGGQASGGAAGQPPSTCGNALVEESESCDGIDLDGQTCASLGFDGGELACVDCELDLSGCTGMERCYDGRDNDGDGDVDCGDDDCAVGCADGCAAPSSLDDPAAVQGDTWGHGDSTSLSCIAQGGAPDLVFEFTPSNTGVVEAVLTSLGPDLALEVRDSCDDAGEVLCRDLQAGSGGVERVVVAAQQGIPLYLVIDGTAPGESGAFELTVESRAVVCGDAKRDPGEACDDGNTDPDDGCSAGCDLETSESEPNDTVAEADLYVAPFTGAIASPGDVDTIAIELAHPASNLIVDTFDLGDGGCYLQLMDTVVDLLAPDGTTVLATDDDGGSGYCAHVAAGGLAPGTYFVVVRAGGATEQSFPYRLAVASDWCGNGLQSDVEECDDGNTEPDDGCGPGCTIE